MADADDASAASAAVLRLQGVSLVRDQTTILDSVDLSVRRRWHCAVLGPNGCGKTTLLRILLRDFYPSVDSQGHVGDVEILGQRVWNIADLRKRIGVVSQVLDQQFALGRTGRMTAAEAVATGLSGVRLARFGPSVEGKTATMVQTRLTDLGMADRAEQRVETMSTGQRRRVLIARALIGDPEILVLDEPTTGLDVVARHQLLATLADLLQRESVTVFLVSHHFEEVLPAFDQVVLLKAGQVAFDGSRREALTEARLSDLFGCRLSVSWASDGRPNVVMRPDC